MSGPIPSHEKSALLYNALTEQFSSLPPDKNRQTRTDIGPLDPNGYESDLHIIVASRRPLHNDFGKSGTELEAQTLPPFDLTQMERPRSADDWVPGSYTLLPGGYELVPNTPANQQVFLENPDDPRYVLYRSLLAKVPKGEVALLEYTPDPDIPFRQNYALVRDIGGTVLETLLERVTANLEFQRTHTKSEHK